MITMDPPKKISLAFTSKKPLLIKKPTLPKPINGIKRPHASLHDSDDEEEAGPTHLEISHFDTAAGGAISHHSVTPKKQKFVIQPHPNSDRLNYKRKGQRSALPTKDQDDVDLPTAAPIEYGLTVPQNKTLENEQGDQENVTTTQLVAKTEDEIALAALMGNTSSNRTIPAITEEEALERDLTDAQDAPTFDDYMSVPIAEFGAACLRGMGWKEGDTINGNNDSKSMVKPRILERRPALLGVGAKPSAATGIEIGEWGKATKGKRVVEGYNPVVLKNKITGEIMTEEELKQISGPPSTSTDLIFDQKKEEEPQSRSGKDRDRYKDRSDDKYRNSKREDKYSSSRDSRREDSQRDDSRSEHRDRRDDSRNRSSRRDDKDRDRKEKRRRTGSRSRSRSQDRNRSSKHSKRADKYDRYERDGKKERRDDDYDRNRRKDRSDRDRATDSRR